MLPVGNWELSIKNTRLCELDSTSTTNRHAAWLDFVGLPNRYLPLGILKSAITTLLLQPYSSKIDNLLFCGCASEKS
jgi:hypothetical protein